MNAKPDWCVDRIALDPYAGAQRVTWRAGRANAEARITGEGVVVRHELECGVPLKLRMPLSAFEGVAARAFENEDGSCTVTLELLHSDPNLSVPLFSGDDPQGAARDWRSWARSTRLPMLIASAEGHVVVDEDSRPPFVRRRRHTAVKRRPSFLRRRRPGRAGPVERIDVREIIART